MKTGSFEMMRVHRAKVLVVVLGVLLASLGLVVTSPAYAATLTLNNTADPGDGDCNPNG